MFTSPSTALFAAGAAITLLFLGLVLFFERREQPTGRYVTKPLASTGFMLAALGAGALGSRYGAFLLAALGLSMAGDLFLLARARPFFLAGLVSFLLGHVAYAVAFFDRGVAWPWAGAAGLVCAIGGGFVLRWLWPHIERPMRGPTIAYFLVISAMVIAAAGTVAAHGRPLIFAAAVGFYLSDISVARDRFLGAGFTNRLWGLPLYYLSQLAFASTIWP